MGAVGGYKGLVVVAWRGEDGHEMHFSTNLSGIEQDLQIQGPDMPPNTFKLDAYTGQLKP